MDKDLFGQKIKEPPKKLTRLEKTVLKYDNDSFDGKVERLKYLNSIFPKNLCLMVDMEFIYTFSEIQNCYMNGNFIASIVLTQAFIEKILVSFFIEQGLEKETKYGLDKMIRYAKKYNLIHTTILDMINNIRLNRNPFVHSQCNHNCTNLSLRSFKNKIYPIIQLQKEATEGLQVLSHILQHNF